MRRAFVSLGSNMGNSQETLSQARDAIAAFNGVRLDAASPIYSTEPQGLHDQPWFVNQVLQLSCSDSWHSDTFLQALLEVEAQLGRVRSPDAALRNGPRCIDIDLLLFGDEHSSQPQCQLPHPRMHKRAFVLVPLRDIAPQVTIGGTSVDNILQGLTYSIEGQRILQ